jgi:hypothetical protein
VLLPERPELFPPELLPLPALPLGEVADPEEPPTVPEEPGEPVPTDEPALPEPTEPLPVLLPELPVCAKPAPASAMAATETVAKRSFLIIAFPWWFYDDRGPARPPNPSIRQWRARCDRSA